MKIDDINFGDECQDIVTRFRGLVTGKAAYSTGCNQVLVQPQLDSNGKFVEALWLDIERLVIIRRNVVEIAQSPTGGPRGADSAPRR